MSRLASRAAAVFPAGSNGEFNLPPELAIVIRRGQGCELWDDQDRHFYDFSLGWGSALVGHARPEVVDAVQRRAPLGANFAYVTEESLLLAEELVRLSPACDSVRFCASGTEATMYCQRLARASTKRPMILKFEGAYHGANEVGVTSLFPTAAPNFPHPDPTSAGIAPLVADSVLVAPFNNLEETARIVAASAKRLAAIIVEPLQRCVPPRPGFLAGLRQLCDQHHVLLIFDEVVTGFRMAYGGAQEYYGVVPDLVGYGKALGGGYPIGAFGGRGDVMDLVREDRLGGDDYVWMASTLGGNPISATAARAALAILRQEGVYPRLHALGRYLREQIATVIKRHDIEAQTIGDGPLAQMIFSNRPVIDYRSSQQGDRARGRKVMLELFRQGIFINPMGTKLYLSLAHDERICDIFCERLDAALKATA